MKVAAVQMKFAPTLDGNLAKIEQAISTLKRRRVDTALFPECCTTGYNYDFSRLRPSDIGHAIERIQEFASDSQMNLLVGTPLFRQRKLQNCLLVIDRKGRIEHCYAKCQLTPADRKTFTPGNHIALFEIDGITSTSVICHERRYPELVRLAAMAGAKILFHPNAGLDTLPVSKNKRGGKDGIAVRAFENAIHYVFANSVGPQGGGKWSAGDSKIVDASGKTVRLADNQNEQIVTARLDLSQATGKYAKEAMEHPKFLSSTWKEAIRKLRAQARKNGRY